MAGNKTRLQAHKVVLTNVRTRDQESEARARRSLTEASSAAEEVRQAAGFITGLIPGIDDVSIGSSIEEREREQTLGNIQSNRVQDSVIFEVQPKLSESGSTSYTEISEIRQPASILIYMGSPSRTFTINAQFVSRSEREAMTNFRYIQKLKSWRKPEAVNFGNISGVTEPPILRLRAYGAVYFKGVKVVMTAVNVDYPDDVDYIYLDNVAVPIIQNVNLTMKESKSIDDLKQFNIVQYRQGTLPGW